MTYQEIATDWYLWYLWCECINNNNDMTLQVFNELTVEEKIGLLEQCFGDDSTDEWDAA